MSPQFQKTNTKFIAMNTSSKDSSTLETLSFVAVVSCVITAAWFFASNLMA